MLARHFLGGLILSNSTQRVPPIVSRPAIPPSLDPPVVPESAAPRPEMAPSPSATPDVVTGRGDSLRSVDGVAAEAGRSEPEWALEESRGSVPVVPDVSRTPTVETTEESTEVSGTADDQASLQLATVGKKLRWYQWPFWLLGRVWDLACLCVLMAVVAAVPVVQLASLGYILVASGNLANRQPWRTALPGLRVAGKLGTFALWVAVSWIPVYLLTDLAYSAQLLQPGSVAAQAWRAGAFLVAFAWVAHVGWAAMRGGRWWHFLWPAPLRFVRLIWRPSMWSRASDQLYELVISLQFPRLWWLGARATVGALLWTCVPVSLMIIGERAHELQPAALVGVVGALGMTLVMLYLPVLQVHMASQNRFLEVFNVRAARHSFMKAPWFYAFSLFVLCALAIPLYLLRIEATPSQLLWAPSLVFVLFMFPAKLLIGTALGYAHGRQRPRHWLVRWPAWGFELVSVLIYVGALYVAQFVAWQGAYVMYFQHAVLVPAPLIST